MLDFSDFVPEPTEINGICRFIEGECRPVPLKELAEFVIRKRLESRAAGNERRIYSPEQSYQVGERIFFCFHGDRVVQGEIMWIGPGYTSELGSFQKIEVSVEGFAEPKRYVSNCPSHPARFSFQNRRADGTETMFITPGQIFSRYEERITPTLENSLCKREDLVCVDCDWFIRNELPEIRPDEIDQCHSCIKAKGSPIPSEALVWDVLKVAPESPKFDTFRFSLDHHLEINKAFIKCRSSEGVLWDVKRAIPPITMRNKLNQEAISLGFIKITKGLRDLIEYCNLTEKITFKAYGEYEVEGFIDKRWNRIYGDDIKTWFKENALKPGDLIHIRSPDTPGGNPTLYATFQEEEENRKSGKKTDRTGKREALLRHRIHGLLLSQNQYVHVKEIQRQIGESLLEEVGLSTVEAILSQNKHLFARIHNCKGLWGLREWEGERLDIDSISLSLAIREDDWVFRILEEAGDFLSVKELAAELAKVFVTRKDKIVELTFLDTTDARLIEFKGKWGLKLWVEKWKERLAEIERKMLDYKRLVDSLSRRKREKEKEEQKLLRLQKRKEVLLDRMTDTQSEMGRLEQKIQAYERRKHTLNERVPRLQKMLSKLGTGLLYCLLLVILAELAVILAFFSDTSYRFIGLLLLSFATLSLLQAIRLRWKERGETETALDRTTKELSQLEPALQKLIERIRIGKGILGECKREIESIDSKIEEVKATIDVIQGQIKNAQQKSEQLNLSELYKERQELTERVKAL